MDYFQSSFSSSLSQYKNQNNSSTSIKFMTENYPFEVTELDECFVKSFPDLLLLRFTSPNVPLGQAKIM